MNMDEFKEQYQYKFIEDTKELMQQLEEYLIQFEKKPEDSTAIEEIFRFMHTLKGSAGMFGFSRIEELSHLLESVFVEIKNGERTVDRSIIDLTLNGVDIVRNILDQKGELSSEQVESYNAAVKQSKSLLNYPEEGPRETEVEQKSESNEEQKSSASRFVFIAIHPDSQLFNRGIRAKNVFNELKDLGNIYTFLIPDEVPGIEEIKFDRFYLKWEIFMLSEEEYDDIEEVFLFFEEEEVTIHDFAKAPVSKEFLSNNCSVYADNETAIDNFINGGAELRERAEEPSKMEETKEISEQTVETKEKDEEVSVDTQTEKTASEQKSQEQTANGTQTSASQKQEDSIRVSANKLDELVNLVSELVTLNSRLILHNQENIQDETLEKSLESLSRLSKSFRENALDLRMMPIHGLTAKFRRLLRDLAGKMEKEVDFIPEGTETKLDKSIIERIEDPLMHVIRNAMDHGIEKPEERLKNNKPRKGVIYFYAFYSGGNVFIQVRDDGKGIDTDYLRRKGIEKGYISEDEHYSDKTLYDLIFKPGFSTALSLSEVSGRGVGMDVVKKSITELRGDIEIDSENGLGTSITLKLPLTLSIIDALLVKVMHWNFFIPVSNIISTFALNSSDLSQKTEMQVEYQNQLIPLIDLVDFFNIQTEDKEPDSYKIVVVDIESKQYGLIVHKIEEQYQAVIKPLGYLHHEQEYLSGASILGNGSLALILNIKALVRMKTSAVNA